ncbi:major facilitator superfamily domain-containing protein [Aspergillus parasiticus]|uniref:Major facilitator superfamily domain-containing protein n=1 Tax=Aspergillus parasiticus TaxID=5067 RepID=A0A5N6D4U5_ASPPA|nr:major facilitator superfamily domain-containing protein [Aspergillus parasiticus]
MSITTDIGICETKVRTPCIRQHDFVDFKSVRLAKTAKDTIRDFLRLFLELSDGGGISRTRFVTGISVNVVLVNHKAAVEAKGVPPLAEWGELVTRMPGSTSTQQDEEKAIEPPVVSESPALDSALPPEGGVRGWLCCAGGSLGLIGIFQTTYQETLLKDYSSSDISWIFTIQLAPIWASGSLFGRIVDAYGPRPVMLPYTFLCLFSLCMMRIGYGLGAGGIFTTSLVCVSQWFVQQRGLTLGITVAGSSIGGVVFPFFLRLVMEDVGFNGMVRYTALFIGIALVGAFFLLSARLPPKKWDPETTWIDFKLFKNRGFAFYALGSYCVMWGLWAPFDYLPSMAQLSGMSDSLALYLLAIVNGADLGAPSATSLFGRIIPGHIGDKVGYFNIIVASAFFSCIAILCLWLPFDYHSSNAGLIVFAVVYGFFSGAFDSIMMPCCAKSGSLETLGRQIGTYQGVIAISTLTGLPIMGAILGRQHNSTFKGLQVFAIATMFIGFVLLLISRNVLAAAHGTWKY